MKVLLVNGSPHEKGSTYSALSIVESALHSNGIETVFAPHSSMESDVRGQQILQTLGENMSIMLKAKNE